MHTAIIIGATGLVGNHLLQQLIRDERYNKIIIFGRRSVNLSDAKIEEHIIEFDNVESWRHLVKGDVLFSSLGTTIRQAGSTNAQYKIDFTYQYEFAKAAASNNVPSYVLVSSAGADAKSIVFYTRMKGELEN